MKSEKNEDGLYIVDAISILSSCAPHSRLSPAKPAYPVKGSLLIGSLPLITPFCTQFSTEKTVETTQPINQGINPSILMRYFKALKKTFGRYSGKE